MKDYQRVTPRDKVEMLNFNGASESMTRFYNYAIRCHDLEDKIESGELCDREEVRKETAREIVEKVYAAVEKARLECEFQDEKGNWLMEESEFLSEFTLGELHRLYAEYGIELFGKTEQVEDEE